MKRIVTGLILIAIGVFVMIDGKDVLFAWMCLIGILGLHEALTMSNILNQWQRLGLHGLYAAAFMFIVYIDFSQMVQWVYLSGIGLYYCMVFPELLLKKNMYKKNQMLTISRYFLYIFFGCSSVMMVRLLEGGGLYIAILFAAIWSCDIFALYGGRQFGRTPLSKLSPKKTVEGTLIGIASASIIVGGICVVYNVNYSIIVLGGGIALMGQLGDLYESLIKRSYGVKDSSNILPGHGGILDRADSTLFVFPMAYAILWAVL